VSAKARAQGQRKVRQHERTKSCMFDHEIEEEVYELLMNVYDGW
jgi:hypothetical protein